jgi:hypothetical protein
MTKNEFHMKFHDPNFGTELYANFTFFFSAEFRSNEHFVMVLETYFANMINLFLVPRRLIKDIDWDTLYFIQTLHTHTHQ